MKEIVLAHPYLSILALVVVCDACTLVWSRLMRHLNVRKMGWPPSHLDADGDWNPSDDSSC